MWIGTAETGQPNDVYSSNDNGVDFASKGMQSPTIWWKSGQGRADERAARLHHRLPGRGHPPDGGQMPPTAHFLRTDDDGAHWTPSPLTGVEFGSTPIVLVAAVDPANADVVY